MRVNHQGERKTYSQRYLTKPHEKNIHSCIVHNQHPHQYNATRGRKAQQGDEQSSRHNIKTCFGPASIHHQWQDPSRGLDRSEKTLYRHQPNKHFLDHLRRHHHETLKF